MEVGFKSCWKHKLFRYALNKNKGNGGNGAGLTKAPVKIWNLGANPTSCLARGLNKLESGEVIKEHMIVITDLLVGAEH